MSTSDCIVCQPTMRNSTTLNCDTRINYSPIVVDERRLPFIYLYPY